MKVILLEDVKKQGKKDDIIEVSDGYAKNYLIKNKLAVAYTEKSKEILNKEIEKRKEKEEAQIAKCEQIAKELKNKEVIIKVKTGAEDKVFGNVSSKQINDELKKMGYEIDKRKIILDYPIASLGTHIIKIELHKKVIGELKVTLKK